MSNNLSTATMIANEIVKAVDFSYANDQSIGNISVALQAILSGGSADYIIGGKVDPYQSGGMNVVIGPIFGHCMSSGVDVIETDTSLPYSIEAADATFDRIDIIQIRGVETEYDFQQRKFRDPESKVETLEGMNTKKKITLDVMVKKGANGSVTAPLADTGYIKLAEILVPAGTVSLTADNIRNITARADGMDNGGWSIETSRTFNPGYLADVIAKFLSAHNEDGSHKNGVIKAANIKFGQENGDVKGAVIPSGQSMGILGQNYTAQISLTEIMVALSVAVNAAYPYANALLGRYTLIPNIPVAASTENVDVVTGGAMVIDGIACTVGQLVFLKDQTELRENGFWEVQTGQWNRYTGYTNENADCFTHRLVLVEAGAVNAGKIFYLDGDAYVVGTDPLNFQESIFSPLDLPGKAIIRRLDGKTNEDKKRESAILSLRLDLTSHADMVEGMGRNLLNVLGVSTISAAMAEIRRRCNNNGEIDSTGIPDFRGIEIGDYIDGLDLSGIGAPTGGTAPQAWIDDYNNNRIVVSGFNTFKGSGDTEVTKNHILFTFRNIVAKARMNATDTNTGGYPATDFRIWLEGANGDGSGSFAAGLKAVLGGNDPLLTIRKLLSTKGNWAWVNCTVWPPSDDEVFGSATWSESNYGDGVKVQFPIYQKSSIYRVKRYNGSRDWWWESSPHASAASFCHVGSNGHAHAHIASAVGGCAPAFCVA
jgi:hypothetical protein